MAWPHLLEQQFMNTPCDHGKYGRCSQTALWCKQGCSGAGHYCVTGSTPLHEAAAAGHQGIVEALVAANADLAIQDCMVSRHCELLRSLLHRSAIVCLTMCISCFIRMLFNDIYYCYLLSLILSLQLLLLAIAVLRAASCGCRAECHCTEPYQLDSCT